MPPTTPASVAGAGEEEELSTHTQVVLVRHGETAWNASRIVQGQMDPELNETGRQQAVVVARRLSSEAKPAAVYSSDLKRAAETAEIIARACGVPNVVLNEALRERHMGYLQGLKWDDAVAKSPDSFKGFDIFKIAEGSDPHSRNQELPGGGESMNQLNERCVSFVNKIAQEHIGERVVVVSHGATILELCRHTDPPGSFIRRHIPNSARNVFRVSGVTGQWTLERCGDVNHLKGNGFLENSFGGNGALGGGESMDQVNERYVSYLTKIAQQHIGERVVVVSHGAAIVGLCRYTDPPDTFIHRDIHNTSLNFFRVSGVTGQWTLERYGDVSHLKGNGFLEYSFGGDGASA